MNNNLKKIVVSALFGAIISAGCFLIIPLPGGIPIVLQDMLAMLSGLILGPVCGSISVAVFLLLGILGLPVFSGKAGITVLTSGPSRGFLIGYLAAAFIGGMILHIFLSNKKEHSKAKEYITIAIAALIATIVVFVLGFIGFKTLTHKTIHETFLAIVVPFIPGNTIKLIIMIPLTRKFRKVVHNYLG